MSQRRDHFNPHIHGARGLFAGMVFFFHVGNSGLRTFAFLSNPWAAAAIQTLQFGVELFFGISGIVILGALERSPSGAAFAWDRVTRIMPVLWATVAVLMAISLAGPVPLPGTWPLLVNLVPPPPPFFYRLLNPAAWSLGYELGFYLFAWVAWRNRHRPALLWALVAAGLAYALVYPRALMMAVGVIVARSLVPRAVVERLGRFAPLWLLLFLAAWLATARVQHVYPGHAVVLGPLHRSLQLWVPSLAPMLLALAFGTLALAGISAGKGIFARFLASPAMQWLGTISYSFYLWHGPFVSGLKRLLEAGGVLPRVGPFAQALLLLALPPALLAAALSQHFIEGRFTRWLRRFGPRKPAGPVDRMIAAEEPVAVGLSSVLYPSEGR